jgi:hypothetical protein
VTWVTGGSKTSALDAYLGGKFSSKKMMMSKIRVIGGVDPENGMANTNAPAIRIGKNGRPHILTGVRETKLGFGTEPVGEEWVMILELENLDQAFSLIEELVALLP